MKFSFKSTLAAAAIICVAPALLSSQSALAQSAPPSAPPGAASGAPGTPKTEVPEEDDFSSTPFTEYGEFNEEADEAAETRFFQTGRFFGISAGAGFEGVAGNRGSLWQGGFPALDLRVHYWFDFSFAMAMAITSAKHSFSDFQGNAISVNLLRLGLDLKYYFDVHNLASAITFANPYLVIGAGNYSKTQSNENLPADSDSALGFTAGAGFEFPVKPRKVYFNLEGKLHFVTFKDTDTTNYVKFGVPNLNGEFYTVTGSFLFTW
ncbi:MAG: hypothetical protein H7222_00180 [Methylotenera sp.]|nr:hypothetical protein [Oligoflexia bacterium]